MRLLRLARLALLFIICGIVWIRPGILLAQYGDECDSWTSTPEYCDDIDGNVNCQASSNHLNYPQDYLGDGTQTVQYETLNCTLIYGDTGGCSSASDLDVEENPACACSDRGGGCSTDDDCCDDLVCSTDSTGDYYGYCESMF
ncbi:MAG TPA: hypothetical protein VGS27_05460 [Candidatus Sulfotelmatobacter sp.]|nr:hypothetical protein [Candidatus Sulfotelmatobacter sp.]